MITRAGYREHHAGAGVVLVADDYHFTSPMDNRLDRETYMKLCWPNSGKLVESLVFFGWDVPHPAPEGEHKG